MTTAPNTPPGGQPLPTKSSLGERASRLYHDGVYIAARLARRLIPEKLFTRLLVRDIIVKSSSGYSDVEYCLELIKRGLGELGLKLRGKRMLELGFGGALHMGMLYRKEGFEEIYLVDKFAAQKFRHCAPHVREILEKYPEHDFHVEAGETGFDYDKNIYKVYFDFLEGLDIPPESLDLIVSISVYEHLSDVAGLLAECRRILAPGGIIFTSIDMSDHFQKYPFHMLKFSEETWRDWLNPPSNLNRLRSPDYEKIFRKQGFTILSKTVRSANATLARRMRPHLSEPFRSCPEEALAELGVIYVLQKAV